MALVALIAGIGLSLACLIADGRRHDNVSRAIWLPVVWMARVASRSFGSWVGSGENSLADPFLLSLLTLAGVMVLAQRAPRVSLLFRENRAFLILLVFVSLSVLWTGDVFVAFKRWVRLVGDVTMALIVLTEVNPFAALLCVIRRPILLLMPLSLVLSLYFPDLGRFEDEVWIGVTVDKNFMGLLCFLASAFLLWNRVMRRRGFVFANGRQLANVPFEIPYLLLSLYLLWGGAGGRESRSSSAILLLALAAGFFLAIEYLKKSRIPVAVLITTGVMAFLVLQVLPRLTGHRSLTDHIIEDVFHKSVSLTDRADFWPLLLKHGFEHPWVGRGLDGFFTAEMVEDVQAELALSGTYFAPSQAHNGYLQIFLNFGVAGLALFALTIMGAFRGIGTHMADEFEFARFRLVLLVCSLVSNWTEATLARPNEFMWFLFLLVAINPLHATRESLVEDVPADPSCSRALRSTCVPMCQKAFGIQLSH